MFRKNFVNGKVSRIYGNKTLAAIALTLMLTVSGAMAVIPAANAHTPPWTIPTYAYINVAPNPIGVGQTVYVSFWLSCPPPTALAQYGDRWKNLTVTVTKPDGTTQTLGPFTSDAVGGSYTTFVPDTVGNYTFVFNFPGQTIKGENPNPITGTSAPASVGDYYQPSTSNKMVLVVQQEPIQGYPQTPLPTDYWQRPIYAENTNWYSIAGNWLGTGAGGSVGAAAEIGLYNATGNYNPYTTAPTSAHILWTKPVAFGGIIGGEFGGTEASNYYSTAVYEPKFAPIIMQGILYYTLYPGSITNPAGWAAVDLRTGQTLWTTNTPLTVPSTTTPPVNQTAGACTKLYCGQILNFVSPNQYGGIAYLWSVGTPAMVASATNIEPGTTTYNLFDAMTGNYILSIVNGSTFIASTNDENGNWIGYYINASTANAYHAPTLVEWNSTLAIMNYGFQTGQLQANSPSFNAWTWRPPQGAIIPFSDGIEWSAPIATNISGAPITLSYAGMSSGVILMHQYNTLGGSAAFQNGWIIQAGYSSVNGQLLWGPVNRTEIPGTRIAYGTTYNGNTGFAIGDGAWVECDLSSLTVTGYNLSTGAKLWGPEVLPNANPLDSYGMQQIVANGTIYIWAYGGDVYAINILTGAINWHYHTPSGGLESPYGVEPLWPRWGRGVLAGGVLFIPEGHEFNPPLFHGAQLLALNITNGQVVWSIHAFAVNGIKAVADGIMVTLNAYDNQIYAFGKGRSATTVTATPGVGNVITIQGTVTDQSPGKTCLGIPAAGTPAISDDSMSAWMEYLYMQKPKPTNATGVPVHITAVYPDGTTHDIGTVTSDIDGNYAIMWTPPTQGLYKITATFEGSNSYYSSHAVTNIGVGAAPASPSASVSPSVSPSVAPSVAPPAVSAPSYDVFMVAAAVVAVVVIVVAALVLRKRRRQSW